MIQRPKYQYRIQERKFSSNVIERGYERENGKWHWEVCLCPTVPKAHGDIMSQTALAALQESEDKKCLLEVGLDGIVLMEVYADPDNPEEIWSCFWENKFNIPKELKEEVMCVLGVDLTFMFFHKEALMVRKK